MRRPKTPLQHGWVPFVRALRSSTEDHYGRFEVGYLGPNGSVLVLSRDIDVITLCDGLRAIDHTHRHLLFASREILGEPKRWPHWIVEGQEAKLELGPELSLLLFSQESGEHFVSPPDGLAPPKPKESSE